MKTIDAGLAFKENMQKHTAQVKTIILHHSAGHGSVESVHAFHQSNGWAGIGYHYYIRQDGSIYAGRPEQYQGAHVSGYNNGSLGICAEGNFETETMTEAQQQAIAKVIADIKSRYNITTVKTHRDYAATACPGANYPLSNILYLAEQYAVAATPQPDLAKIVESLKEIIEQLEVLK